MLHCNPIIEGIVDPSTVAVDVKWWILGDESDDAEPKRGGDVISQKKIVFEESFSLSTKTFSTLNRQYWKVGDTVSG